MNKKNITCFICSLASGGAEHQLTELCRMLVDRGYVVTIATFADVEDHYPCATGVMRKRIAPNKGKIGKILSIFWYFLRVRTDVVISFGQRESFLCLIPLFFRRKIKVINGERNLTIGRNSRIERILVKWLYRRSDFIVSNSYSQARNIVSLAPNLANKTKTIINYLDTNLYVPSSEPQHKNPLRIGVFCRYAPQKNCERFIRVVELLKNKGLSFRIDWYGNQFGKNGQANDYFMKIKGVADSLDLGDYLYLNNNIKNVNEVMPQYDAICLPSLWEGFSNTIAEAISCGKLMLVSDVSDNSVMVEDNYNGFLFDPTSEEQICGALEKFIHSTSEQRKIMGQRSRERALHLFGAHGFIEEYLKLIEE